MSYEFLQTLRFILIAVLWIGFYFLEGFDFGVGMVLPFLGKKDEERRAILLDGEVQVLESLFLLSRIVLQQ